MSKISIAFAVNDGYVDHLLIAIYSLLRNNKNSKFDIYVLQKDFTNDSHAKLLKLQKHFSNARIIIIDMTKMMYMFKGISLVIDYISIETYFRFVLAELMPDLDKILYLDADILVTGDISGIWKSDIQKYYAAGVEDPHIKNDQYKRQINFDEHELYVNAGVLLFNLKMIREKNIVEKLFRAVKKMPHIKYQDQDIINIVFRKRIKKINIIYNFLWYYQENNRKEYEKARIVHFTGPFKPWQDYGLNGRPYWFYEYDKTVDQFNRKINNQPDIRTIHYGLLTYATENIGDDIQSIAARQFLPRVDYYIDRDNIDGLNYKNAKLVKLIMNGWYTHKPENWPPLTSSISPLLISMYFSSAHNARVKKAISTEQSKAFILNNGGKVGTRDRSTLNYLIKNNIDSYFSSCLTLTLQKSMSIKKQDYILAVDVSQDVYNVMQKQTARDIIKLTPEILTSTMNPEERLEIAEWFLSIIQSAHCVVTTRLHTALPSLALETPVLFLQKKDHREADRLDGLIQLTHHLSDHDYINNPGQYDINKPIKNPIKYKTYRKNLIKQCEKFTGFFNKKGYLRSEPPFKLDNPRFIQRFFDSLHVAYRNQTMNEILSSKTNNANSELEKYAVHLKQLELEHANLVNERRDLIIAKRRYDQIMRIPRALRRRYAKLGDNKNNV